MDPAHSGPVPSRVVEPYNQGPGTVLFLILMIILRILLVGGIVVLFFFAVTSSGWLYIPAIILSLFFAGIMLTDFITGGGYGAIGADNIVPKEEFYQKLESLVPTLDIEIKTVFESHHGDETKTIKVTQGMELSGCRDYTNTSGSATPSLRGISGPIMVCPCIEHTMGEQAKRVVDAYLKAIKEAVELRKPGHKVSVTSKSGLKKFPSTLYRLVDNPSDTGLPSKCIATLLNFIFCGWLYVHFADRSTHVRVHIHHAIGEFHPPHEPHVLAEAFDSPTKLVTADGIIDSLQDLIRYATTPVQSNEGKEDRATELKADDQPPPTEETTQSSSPLQKAEGPTPPTSAPQEPMVAFPSEPTL